MSASKLPFHLSSAHPKKAERALLRGHKLGAKSKNPNKTVPMAQMPGSEFYKPKGALSGMLARNGIRFRPQQKSFHCKLCPRKFAYKSLLSRHLLKHNQEMISTNHYCKICWRKFSSMSELRLHSRLHIIKREKPFKCPYCQKRFLRYIGMQRHVRTHTGEKPFQCNQCSTRFAQRGHLTRHLIFRENEINKPIKCDLCCRRFSSQRAVSKHKQVHYPKTYYPIKVHTSSENLADKFDADVRDSGNMIGTKKSYADVKVSTLIVENVGG